MKENDKFSRSGIFAILFCIIVALFAAATGNVSQGYQADAFAKSLESLTVLVVLALIIERTGAVLNGMLFREETTRIQLALRFVFARAPFLSVADADRDIRIASAENASLEEKKSRSLLVVSLILGTLVSSAGARILDSVLVSHDFPTREPGAQNDPTWFDLLFSQAGVFVLIDIILVTGLLAGGSQGIAHIITVIGDLQGNNGGAQDPLRTALDRTRGAFRDNSRISELAMLDVSETQAYGEGQSLEPLYSSHDTNFSDKTGPWLIADDMEFEVCGLASEFKRVGVLSSASGLFPGWPTDPRLASSLTRLLMQVDAVYPNRVKSSDGQIGDAAHCGRDPSSWRSDHCPRIKDGSVGVVTALDLTDDPANGCSMDTLTEAIRTAKDARIKYVIWNRRIFSSYARNGRAAWEWGAYSGSSPHEKHAHFSVVADKALYDDQKDWKLV